MLSMTVEIDSQTFASVDMAATYLEDDLNRRVDSAMVEITAEMRRALDKVYESLERKHGRPWPLGGAPFGTDSSRQRLGRRSGRGLRSIKESINVSGDTNQAQGSISTGKLTVHETGAVITAKRAKYLALPMIQALDSRGLPRKAGPRAWRNTYVARSKKGNLIIFQKRTGGKVVPLYLLKKKVKMPARLKMGETFESMVPYFTAKAMRQIEKALG